ncbi:hypothetical protein ABPG75_013538 [Micractinium tetrahymenae]
MAAQGWSARQAPALLAPLLLLLLLSTATAVLSQPCTNTGGSGTTPQFVCSGELSSDDVQSLLDDVFDAAESAPGPIQVILRSVKLTAQQVSFSRAAAFPLGTKAGGPGDRTFQLIIEDSSITRNQFVIFGAMAAQAGLAVDLQVTNSQVLDNQLIAAAGIASGSAGKANLTITNADIRGNMVAAAGGLALSTTADAVAAGTGGNASSNSLAVAGLIGSGGTAAAQAAVDAVPAESNTLLGAGLPFIEEPLVSSIISAVFNAVFVDSSTLSAGLADIQGQLCSSLSGGSLQRFAEDRNLESVAAVAWGLLCGNSSAAGAPGPVHLGDIPAMVDDPYNTTGTLHTMSLLLTGKGHLRLKSLRGAFNFAARHPGTLADLVSLVAVEDRKACSRP